MSRHHFTRSICSVAKLPCLIKFEVERKRSEFGLYQQLGILKMTYRDCRGENDKIAIIVLGPELLFVTGLMKFVTAIARLVCRDRKKNWHKGCKFRRWLGKVQ